MMILTHPSQLPAVKWEDIKSILMQRFHELSSPSPSPYQPQEQGYFILVEPGDTDEKLAAETGYAITKDIINDSQYGDSDFSPNFEYLEDHGSFYEVVYVLTDSGFTLVFIIPKAAGVESTLLELCAEYAIQFNS